MTGRLLLRSSDQELIPPDQLRRAAARLDPESPEQRPVEALRRIPIPGTDHDVVEHAPSRPRAPSRGTPCVRSSRGLDEHLGGQPVSTTTPLVHEHDRVGDLAGEPHLVGDHDHRHPVSRERAHHVEHVADELGVERRGRLVEQHQLRLHRQRPRDRDPLLLPARQLRPGRSSSLSPRPTRSSSSRARSRAPRRARTLHAPGPAPASRSRARSCAGTG